MRYYLLSVHPSANPPENLVHRDEKLLDKSSVGLSKWTLSGACEGRKRDILFFGKDTPRPDANAMSQHTKTPMENAR